MPAAPGIERIGHAHGAVERADGDAVAGGMAASYLTLWPIFSVPPSSSIGLRTAMASLKGIWPGSSPSVKQAVARAHMGKRNVAGLVRRQRQRDAHKVRCMGSTEVVSVSKATKP